MQQLAEEREESLDQSLAGEGVEILTPVAVTVSDSDTLTLDLVGRYRCHKISVLVRGLGWVDEPITRLIRRCVDWWYAFKPRWNKFYAIVPRVTYNGFYIVRANEGWYNCKYAKAKIDLGVNVYQYNWKG